MKSKSNLVCAGLDDGYLWPFLVSIFAAKSHASQDFRVAVGSINGGLSDKSKKIIREFAQFMQIPFEIRDFNLNEDLQTAHLNIQTYTRLLWLDTLDEKFLWLDADTLPLENWEGVFDQLENEPPSIVLAAAIDSTIINNMDKSPKNAAYIAGGISYFNAGIFFANPKAWRDRGHSQRWRKVGTTHKELGFNEFDQDILNYLLFQDKKIMPPDFNAMVMPSSSIGQKILHFTGNPKPWHFDEIAKRYFISIEVLKDIENGLGAFGGANWVYEYQNYWRHEQALIDFCKLSPELGSELVKLHQTCRRELMSHKDKLKSMLLSASGRKWF